ncbi:MAG: EpsG family protein [Victivallaceae bacterium]|nr:EpsG family protein [Victivallaceae bacterium]
MYDMVILDPFSSGILYSAVFLCCFLFLCIPPTRRILRIVGVAAAIALPAFLSGMRDESVGTDYRHYQATHTYLLQDDHTIDEFFETQYAFKEKGYSYFMYFASQYFSDVRVVFGLLYAFFLSIAMLGLQQFSKFVPLKYSYTSFLICNLLFSWNGLRQSLGTTIAMLALGCLWNKKHPFLKCAACFLLAFYFHISSLIFVLMVPVILFPHQIWALMFIGVVLLISAGQIITASGYSSYLSEEKMSGAIVLLRTMIVYLPLLIYCGHMLQTTKNVAMAKPTSSSIPMEKDPHPVALSADDKNAQNKIFDLTTATHRLLMMFFIALALCIALQVFAIWSSVSLRLLVMFYPIVSLYSAYIFFRSEFCGKLLSVIFVIGYLFLYCYMIGGTGECNFYAFYI